MTGINKANRATHADSVRNHPQNIELEIANILIGMAGRTSQSAAPRRHAAAQGLLGLRSGPASSAVGARTIARSIPRDDVVKVAYVGYRNVDTGVLLKDMVRRSPEFARRLRAAFSKAGFSGSPPRANGSRKAVVVKLPRGKSMTLHRGDISLTMTNYTRLAELAFADAAPPVLHNNTERVTHPIRVFPIPLPALDLGSVPNERLDQPVGEPWPDFITARQFTPRGDNLDLTKRVYLCLQQRSQEIEELLDLGLEPQNLRTILSCESPRNECNEDTRELVDALYNRREVIKAMINNGGIPSSQISFLLRGSIGKKERIRILMTPKNADTFCELYNHMRYVGADSSGGFGPAAINHKIHKQHGWFRAASSDKWENDFQQAYQWLAENRTMAWSTIL